MYFQWTPTLLEMLGPHSRPGPTPTAYPGFSRLRQIKEIRANSNGHRWGVDFNRAQASQGIGDDSKQRYPGLTVVHVASGERMPFAMSITGGSYYTDSNSPYALFGTDGYFPTAVPQVNDYIYLLYVKH
jgi:hypothetical protein